VNFFSGGLAAWRLKIFDAVGAVGSRKGLPYCNTHCGRATGCAQLQLVPLDRVFRGHSIDAHFSLGGRRSVFFFSILIKIVF
jgi:hypothetical protein